MRWGKKWGSASKWGKPGTGPADACKLAMDRILAQMDDTVGNDDFRTMMCVIAEGFGADADVARGIIGAFDVTLAQGEQLDFIGSTIGLPRFGFSDERYRVFLEIQIDLILSFDQEGANYTGTHNNLLKIIRTFIGPTPGERIRLKGFAPKSYVVTIPGVDLAELPILINFLCLAQYSEVLGQVIILVSGGALWASSQVAVTNSGVWASSQVAVPGSSLWSFVVTIGDEPCD